MALTIKAPQTFTAPVSINLLGGGKETLTVTYRHKTRQQVKDLIAGLAERQDEEVIAELVADWEGADVAFSPAALLELIDNHPGATTALLGGFFQAYADARAGN
jgi:hypothetical protein